MTQTYYSILEQIARFTTEEKKPRLLCVSKGQPIEKIKELADLGQIDFAENYLQEMQAKKEVLTYLPLRWHFIGRLQSNKIKKIVEIADEIQSLASLEHAQKIAQAARMLDKAPYPVFILVNVGDEDSKDGIALSELLPFSESLKDIPELAVQGIMAIPPAMLADHPKEQASVYKELRIVADLIGKGFLSLGMSQDYISALQAGSDILRIGSGIFGLRKQNKTYF